MLVTILVAIALVLGVLALLRVPSSVDLTAAAVVLIAIALLVTKFG